MHEITAADHDRLRACLALAAERVELLERATAGLSDEQIAAIPRLVAWFTASNRLGTPAAHKRWKQEWDDLEKLFPPRQS